MHFSQKITYRFSFMFGFMYVPLYRKPKTTSEMTTTSQNTETKTQYQVFYTSLGKEKCRVEFAYSKNEAEVQAKEYFKNFGNGDESEIETVPFGGSN